MDETVVCDGSREIKEFMNTREHGVSIVIPTIGRPTEVLDCIRSFKGQIPPEVEVVIVDAGREQSVVAEAVLHEWPNSRVLRAPVQNAGIQRNAGARAAQGEIVVFLDDDCYVQEAWWPKIIAPFDDSAVGAVAGAVWCNPNPKFTNDRGGYVNFFGYPVQVTHRGIGAPREVDWPLSTNMAVRTRVMTEVGGFSEIYGIYDEDVDLGLKIRRAGWKIMFEPEAAVFHYYLKRPGRIPTKQTQFRAGRNRAMLLVRNYGVSVRLLLFLLTAPVLRLGQSGYGACLCVVKHLGHWAAYLCGIVMGVVEGFRHPVEKDKDRFLDRV
jgi:GT2 family glycosyltransferase